MHHNIYHRLKLYDLRYLAINLKFLTRPYTFVLENLLCVKLNHSHYNLYNQIYNYNIRYKKNMVPLIVDLRVASPVSYCS